MQQEVLNIMQRYLGANPSDFKLKSWSELRNRATSEILSLVEPKKQIEMPYLYEQLIRIKEQHELISNTMYNNLEHITKYIDPIHESYDVFIFTYFYSFGVNPKSKSVDSFHKTNNNKILVVGDYMIFDLVNIFEVENFGTIITETLDPHEFYEFLKFDKKFNINAIDLTRFGVDIQMVIFKYK